jgi:cytosine/adenosine deaminase-related metal-dependent hydrolase
MADKSFTARWVFPVSGPPLERGVLMISDGRVVAVAKHGRAKPDLDFGNAAIVPGFVNAHTHLDLTGACGLTPPTPDFTAWLRSVISFRKAGNFIQALADIQEGVAECRRYGTTLVGDITAVANHSIGCLLSAPMRSVVFRELIGMRRESQLGVLAALQSILKTIDMDAVRVGLSPHAPYSVHRNLLKTVAKQNAPIAIHLAESAAEMKLLERHSGPFVPFLAELNAWEPAGFVENAADVVHLVSAAPSALLIHANFLSPDIPIPAHVSIVYCPRTHAAFGHPPHPFRQFLTRGVRVALGTDSLASNPDLSLLAEARFIASRYSDFDRSTLLRMATISGAEALGWANETGSLEPRKSADFAVVTLPNRDESDPHELLFNSDLPVQSTWFRGEKVFELA